MVKSTITTLWRYTNLLIIIIIIMTEWLPLALGVYVTVGCLSVCLSVCAVLRHIRWSGDW